MGLPFYPQPKPKHKRGKPTMSELGKVTPEVYEELVVRSGGLCERCGKPLVFGSRRTCLQAAHLLRRTKGGRGDQPWMMMYLCGPSVNTGTCHNWVDYTAVGREWAKAQIPRLIERYREEDWPA